MDKVFPQRNLERKRSIEIFRGVDQIKWHGGLSVLQSYLRLDHPGLFLHVQSIIRNENLAPQV